MSIDIYEKLCKNFKNKKIFIIDRETLSSYKDIKDEFENYKKVKEENKKQYEESQKSKNKSGGNVQVIAYDCDEELDSECQSDNNEIDDYGNEFDGDEKNYDNKFSSEEENSSDEENSSEDEHPIVSVIEDMVN
jgi:hypothetical protein